MASPFIVGSYTYATDAYSMVRCKTERVDFKFENTEQPLNAEAAIPEINASEIIDLDNISWTDLMTVDEKIGDGNDVICGHCEGNGSCEDSFVYKNKCYDYEYDCPVCDGSGYEEKVQMIPTGKKTFGMNDMIRFKDAFFYARRFYKLKQVKDLIKADVELISYSGNNKAVLFRIGFLEVLLMPVIQNSNTDVIVRIG